VEQSKTVIKHMRCEGENHSMLLIMIAWAQLETGMGFALMASPEKKVPHLECAWLQSIRTGLAKTNARIERTESAVYADRRSDDCHLMDQICESKGFTDNQVRRINACRLFLKVTLLSDIMTACGKRIHPAYYEGAETITHNWASVTYPRQARPDKTSWAFWRRALNTIYLRDDKTTLRRPLGQWYPSAPYHHQWKWHYSPDDIIHHDQTSQQLTRHPFISSVRRQFRFSREGNASPQMPTASFPIKATKYPLHLGVPFHQIFPFPITPVIPTPGTIGEMKTQLPKSLFRLVEHTESLTNIPTALHCLNLQQPIRLACDGGAYPGRASYG
jgi:hypothetical protein